MRCSSDTKIGWPISLLRILRPLGYSCETGLKQDLRDRPVTRPDPINIVDPVIQRPGDIVQVCFVHSATMTPTTAMMMMLVVVMIMMMTKCRKDVLEEATVTAFLLTVFVID